MARFDYVRTLSVRARMRGVVGAKCWEYRTSLLRTACGRVAKETYPEQPVDCAQRARR